MICYPHHSPLTYSHPVPLPKLRFSLFSQRRKRRTGWREGRKGKEENAKPSSKHQNNLPLQSKINNAKVVIIIRHVPDLKTWWSALMLLQLCMSPGFQDLSESNRALCNVERPRGKMRKRAPGKDEPVTVVTRSWIWGGTSVHISSLPYPCMSTMPSWASRRVTEKMLLVTKHCLPKSIFHKEI